MTQDLLVPRSAESYPRPVRGTLLYGILWLMLWGGYNTDFGRLLEPGFPRNALDLLHGLRALLPILAGWLAGLMLLAKGTPPRRTLAGPLGLLAVYALIGIISSLLLSSQPLTAVYWACQYASVILVLWASLSEVDPLPCLSRLMGLNWIVVVLLAAAILSAIWLDPEVKLQPGGLLVVQPPRGGRFTVGGTIWDVHHTVYGCGKIRCHSRACGLGQALAGHCEVQDYLGVRASLLRVRHSLAASAHGALSFPGWRVPAPVVAPQLKAAFPRRGSGGRSAARRHGILPGFMVVPDARCAA